MGQKIKFYRLRLEMSQEDLALEAGISMGSVSEIENGVNIPNQSTVHKLSVALQLTPKEIAYVFGVNLYIPGKK